jgi:hypothetical protein
LEESCHSDNDEAGEVSCKISFIQGARLIGFLHRWQDQMEHHRNLCVYILSKDTKLDSHALYIENGDLTSERSSVNHRKGMKDEFVAKHPIWTIPSIGNDKRDILQFVSCHPTLPMSFSMPGEDIDAASSTTNTTFSWIVILRIFDMIIATNILAHFPFAPILGHMGNWRLSQCLIST